MATQGLQFDTIMQDQQGLTRDQLAAKAQAATVQSPAATVNPVGSGGAITPESLTPATPVNLPQSSYSPTQSATTIQNATSATKSLADYIKEATPPTTATDTQEQDILNKISDLTARDANRTADQGAAEATAGVPGYKQALAEANGKVAVANAEYSALQARLNEATASREAQGIATGTPAVFYQGENAAITRQFNAQLASKAAEAGMYAAQAQAASGNLTSALAIANSAIATKYAPIEDELKVKQAQLNAIQPLLNREQTATANALQRQYNDQQQKIADEKAKAQQNTQIALTAGVATKYANRNGEFFDTTTGKTFENPTDFFKAAGVSSFEEAYKKGLVTDISNQRLTDINTVQQMMAKYPDAGIKASDSLDAAATKLKNSRIYRKETYIAPNAYSGGGGGVYVPGADPQVDSYIAAVRNGNGTLANVPQGIRGLVAQGLNQSATPLVDSATDAKVKAIIASKPGDGGWGDTFTAIKNAIGNDAAQKYDPWLKSVFNDKADPAQLGTSQTYTPLAGSRFALEATRITAPYTKLPAYETLSQAMVYLPRIAAAAANPGSVGDAELLDSIVKLNTGGNAVTQEQVHLITHYGSYEDKINRFKNQLSKKGGALSDQQRAELVAIAKETNDNYQKVYQPIYDQATSQLRQAGIPQQFWTIPDLNTLQNAGQKAGDEASLSVIPKGTDGAAYGFPGYVSDGTQWVPK